MSAGAAAEAAAGARGASSGRRLERGLSDRGCAEKREGSVVVGKCADNHSAGE